MSSFIRYSLGMVLFFVAISTESANAASFDCKKASSTIEQMICRSPDLNAFDSQLQEAYAGALDRSNHPDQIRSDQRAWVRVRDACGDEKCLSAVYEKRIAALGKVSDEPAICADGSTPAVNACTAEYAHRADLELARYVAAARKRLMDEASEDLNPQKPSTTLAAFDASQKSWEVYRKAECDAVYDWWSSGTIRGAMYGGCMEAVTKARTEDIWNTWLSFMDNTPPLMPKPTTR